MINLNLIYDDCIDIWINGYYRRVILNPTPYILSDYIYMMNLMYEVVQWFMIIQT